MDGEKMRLVMLKEIGYQRKIEIEKKLTRQLNHKKRR